MMNSLMKLKIINLQQYIKILCEFIFILTKMSEIETSELIDTTENKPKIEQVDAEEDVEQPEEIKRLIDFKPVSKLTEDEKSYLINLYKNGGEDNHFKVYFYKNGTNKIVKKKQPPQRISAKLLEKIENSKKPSLTNEQLLMEHVIDLETKFATLQQKHKKLKKYYKSLHEDIYADDNEVNITEATESIPATQTQDNNNEQTNEQVNEIDNQNINILAGNKVDNNDNNNYVDIAEGADNEVINIEQNYQYNYINRLRRQPKGYRKMMSMKGY